MKISLTPSMKKRIHDDITAIKLVLKKELDEPIRELYQGKHDRAMKVWCDGYIII